MQQAIISIIIIILIVIINCNNALKIHEPSFIKGTIPFSIANFGLSYVSPTCNKYLVVEADPMNACGGLKGDYKNKVVFVKRGKCTFVQKALVVQQAGGIGMIVWNPDSNSITAPTTTITVPTTDTTTTSEETNTIKIDGQQLLAALNKQSLDSNINIEQVTNQIQQIIQQQQPSQIQQMTVTGTTTTTTTTASTPSTQSIEIQQLMTMSDDGNGKHARIRSVLITNKDGQKFKNALDMGYKIRVTLGYCSMLKYSYFN
jgi:hypothetical protein